MKRIINIIKYLLLPYGFFILVIYFLITIIADILLIPFVFIFKLNGSDDKYFYLISKI